MAGLESSVRGLGAVGEDPFNVDYSNGYDGNEGRSKTEKGSSSN